jgi:hypothetical protein
MEYFLVIDESRRNPICGLGGYFISEVNLKKAVENFQNFKKKELKVKSSSPIKWSLPTSEQKDSKRYSDIIKSLKENNITEQQYREKVIDFISKIEGIEPICVFLHDVRSDSGHLPVDDFYIWGFRFLLQSASIFAENKNPSDKAKFSLIVLKDLHKFKDFYIEYKNFYYDGSHIPYTDRNTGEQKSVDYKPLKNLNFFDSLTEARTVESLPIQIADFIIGSLVYFGRAGYALNQEDNDGNRKTKYSSVKIVQPIISIMKKIYGNRILGKGVKVHPKNTGLYSWLCTVDFS